MRWIWKKKETGMTTQVAKLFEIKRKIFEKIKFAKKKDKKKTKIMNQKQNQ